MPAMPLAHLSWAIADNADRAACDAFFIDVFGAQTAYEMRVTPETQALGLDREERLMLIGDTMLIPIAPAGAGAAPGSPTGDMLRRSAGPNRWLGVALKVADLREADGWFRAMGFTLHYDPGMDAHYFLIARRQAMGMRIEVLQQDLPGDLRRQPGWSPVAWRDDHPLGIIGLQAIALSAPSIGAARDLFAERFRWPEIGERYRAADAAQCVAFNMGDTVIEAMVPMRDDTPLARHLARIQGIHAITFQVRDAQAAADHLSGRGFRLIGEVGDRFAIAPDQAHGRTIWLTGQVPDGYPPAGSRLGEPARFPAVPAIPGDRIPF